MSTVGPPTRSASQPVSPIAAVPSQRVVLVTGGTSGIGWAIAQAFAEDGAEVIVTGLTDDEVVRAAAESAVRLASGNALQPGAGRVSARRLDVRDDRGVADLAASLPRLDVLVNAAGMILRGAREQQPADFAQVIEVNLTGVMRVSAACRPLLVRSKGCVLNLASMLSFFGSGAAPAYSASKGGLAQLTKSLAIAWAADGIRVNALAPGWIETPLTDPLRSDPQKSQAILARTPLGRWGVPAEVAPAALFLCSPAAGFITGVVLPVDGGYSIA